MEKIPTKELIFRKVSVWSPPLQIVFKKNVFIEEHLSKNVSERLITSASATFAVSEWLLFYISTWHFLKRGCISNFGNCILFKNTL